MNKMIWSDDYSVGNKTLDEQHQKILCLINTLQEHVNHSVEHKVITETLYEMIKYSNQHLGYEESLLNELGYSGLGEHKKSHYHYLQKIAEIAIEASDELKDQVAFEELLLFLQSWWTNHVLVEDMEYKAFLESKNCSEE